VGQGSPRAFDKAVWAWPPVGAVDAGPVEIQLTEGMVLRCPEAAPRSTTHYAAYPEIGHSDTVWRKLWLRRLQERICLSAEQRKTQRAEARGEFELERVLSCGRADLWGRTKLDFDSSEPFDHLRSPTLGAAIKIRSVLGGGRVFFGRRFLS